MPALAETPATLTIAALFVNTAVFVLSQTAPETGLVAEDHVSPELSQVASPPSVVPFAVQYRELPAGTPLEIIAPEKESGPLRPAVPPDASESQL